MTRWRFINSCASNDDDAFPAQSRWLRSAFGTRSEGLRRGRLSKGQRNGVADYCYTAGTDCERPMRSRPYPAGCPAIMPSHRTLAISRIEVGPHVLTKRRIFDGRVQSIGRPCGSRQAMYATFCNIAPCFRYSLPEPRDTDASELGSAVEGRADADSGALESVGGRCCTTARGTHMPR